MNGPHPRQWRAVLREAQMPDPPPAGLGVTVSREDGGRLFMQFTACDESTGFRSQSVFHIPVSVDELWRLRNHLSDVLSDVS